MSLCYLEAPCRKWVSIVVTWWNTSPWQLNNFLFLLAIFHLLNHRCSRSFEMLKQQITCLNPFDAVISLP